MRSRAKIFEILCDEVLCKPVFGVDDSKLGHGLEENLTAFEIALKSVSKGKTPSGFYLHSTIINMISRHEAEIAK